MITLENDCVDCGLPCMGDNCPYRDVPHISCDNCGDECSEVYEVNGEHLCETCLLNAFPKITEENAREMME